MKITHIMKCLEILTMTDKWLHAYDFNSYGDVFIGHRGCARISDCQKQFPYLVEVQNDPEKRRLYIYRLRWNELTDGMERLKKDNIDIYNFLKDKLLRKSIKWSEYKLVAEETPEHNIIMVNKLVEIK